MKGVEGYWVWKHEIINNTLKELNKNDLVVYCDAEHPLITMQKKGSLSI